ncbi:LLM class flavin-dependent oxidoreductase [Saccharothrix violaceirubra]|uniref:Alkanesulfonate monooxygenase SsuD/methylene tetrahydromethanopterin reductase-like flavin-dependent oxidoreductase (Luciferase family) n=1 Tax=Saccharothrix violaceirubra TaxID=413306 RepID=A0A7W7WTQ2_9PSEU|nr:LLM class flavin-dependent oxidoreductase [Saccharothrix violaceirubra]MBB4963349.1 alkanesulfonate monooxygenase SsuD/methylene tetrahydromethanopterin reductase-like flavin-dependent oxidoreductase (luciferase family) [Saccharothrix violaceirubra]
MGTGLHLAVALEGSGWHPAAPHDGDARFTAGYWADLVREAERGLLDFVTFEDEFGPVGRLDSVQVAARVAPLTRNIGLVPTAIVTHTEPFHLSKALATLDYVSKGRAGVRLRGSWKEVDYAHVGRRTFSEPVTREVDDDLLAETADYAEVLRRLWDSWEDDAEIRDAATGRFIDRDKLHYIDFEGKWFSVKGPSITPRPPQGNLPVAVLSHEQVAHDLAKAAADIVFVTPQDFDDAREIATQTEGVLRFADFVVHFDADRKARLDAVATEDSDAYIFTGDPGALADLLLEWRTLGYEGFRLRPGSLPDDLNVITKQLVPELQRRGVFRTAYEADTFRGLLGLPRPANRYASA